MHKQRHGSRAGYAQTVQSLEAALVNPPTVSSRLKRLAVVGIGDGHKFPARLPPGETMVIGNLTHSVAGLGPPGKPPELHGMVMTPSLPSLAASTPRTMCGFSTCLRGLRRTSHGEARKCLAPPLPPPSSQSLSTTSPTRKMLPLCHVSSRETEPTPQQGAEEQQESGA